MKVQVLPGTQGVVATIPSQDGGSIPFGKTSWRIARHGNGNLVVQQTTNPIV